MTALGNVMALIRELEQGEGAARATEAPTRPAPRSGIEFPARCSCVCASSLGDVLGFIREAQGDGLQELIATLPPLRAPRNSVAA